MLDILAFEHAFGFAEFDFHTVRARRSDGCHFISWEFTFGETGEHFAPDIPRRSDYSNPIPHNSRLPC